MNIENGRAHVIIPVGHELCIWVPFWSCTQNLSTEYCIVTLHPYGRAATIEVKTGAYRLHGHEVAQASRKARMAPQIAEAQFFSDIPAELVTQLGSHWYYKDAKEHLDTLIAKYGKRFPAKKMPATIDIKHLQRIQQGQCDYDLVEIPNLHDTLHVQ